MFDKSADLYDVIYSTFKDYEVEAEKVRTLIQARQPAARTLLDVACGTGEHIKHLATHFEITGVDLDPAMLAIAAGKNPGVEFVEGDMTTLDLGRTFDAVTCLFSSIGYVADDEGLDAAAGALARHVRVGGLVLVEPWLTPDVATDGFVGLVTVDEDDLKIARVSNTRIEDGKTVMHFHYLVARTGENVAHFTETHVAGLFTLERYTQALEAAGLDVDHDPDGLMGRGLFICTKR